MLLTLGFLGLGLNGWATYSGIASEDLPPFVFAGGGELSWGEEGYELGLGANFTKVSAQGASVTLREVYLSGGPSFEGERFSWGFRLGVNSLGLASKETEAVESPNYAGLKACLWLGKGLGRLSLAGSLYPTREGLYPMLFLGAGLVIRRTP